MDTTNEQLMKSLGLDALPPEEKAVVMEKFADTLFQAVMVRGLELLPEDKKDLLDEAIKKSPESAQDVLMDFFMANIPNFQSVVDEEVNRVKDQIVKVVGKPGA
jgi:hypothetical protein